MIIRCDEGHRDALLRLLESQPLQNTFLLADIEGYGFEVDFQKVWMETDAEKPAVYLLFYDNLSVFAPAAENLNAAWVARLMAEHDVSCLMGRLELVAPLAEAGGVPLNSKVLCGRRTPVPGPDDDSIKVAGPEDVDEIHAFLNTIPEFASMYASRDMIAGRIATGGGVHLIIREEGRIIAHGNTAAASRHAVMMGGIATAQPYRHRGYAGRIVAQLCRIIARQGKTPCTLSTKGFYDDYYQPEGFDFLCDWGMTTKK